MRVANMRIHVERDIRRAREFKHLNNTVAIHHTDLISDEVAIAFLLGNFHQPLIGKDFFDDQYVDDLDMLMLATERLSRKPHR